ncbi:uncharacterized protein [Solanum tuberosum]|uniref:uncharacterized protein n=1 Tax=Solanum tuberosum TaxID=4113 RepID=UPI000739FD06|nr:PREDICTED: uncharacterized protein LOC107061759 [Solanum tuberosum]
MWDKLEVTYEGTEKVKETIISLLVYKYELFQMKEGETIESMFAQLSKIIGELKASGKTYPQIEHIRRVLRSLPSQWNAKVVALECMNLNTITYEEKQQKRKKLWMSGNQKNRALSSWSNEDNPKHENEEIGNICFMAIGESSTKELSKKAKGKWYLDSGCSNHITGDKNLFKSVTEYKRGNIQFGDNSKGTVIGIGTICFNESCDLTNDTLKNFEFFCEKFQRDKGYNITSIRSDHGGEFENKLFEDFCNENGWKYNIGKFDARSDEGIFLGYSKPSISYRNFNNRTLSIEESIHVEFDDSSKSIEIRSSTDEEDNQIMISTQKELNSLEELTAEETPIKPINETVPNEWKSEPNYTKKFIIGDLNEGMKTRASRRNEAKVALISQLEPKKINQAFTNKHWVKVIKEELDQFDKNQVTKTTEKAPVVHAKFLENLYFPGIEFCISFNHRVRIYSDKLMLCTNSMDVTSIK